MGRNSRWPARGPAGSVSGLQRGLTHLNVVVNFAFAASALWGWPARGPAGCRASSADSLQCGHGCHESMSLLSMFLLLRRYGPPGEASPVCKQSRFTSSCAWLESSNKVGLPIRGFENAEDSVDDVQENGARAREVRDKHTHNLLKLTYFSSL